MIAAFGARRLVRPATSVRASIAAGAGAALAASAILSASVGARESDEAALAVRDRPHDAAADGSTSTAATATPSNSISSTTTTAARCACERAAASTSSSSGPGELRPPSRGGLLAQFRNRRSRRPPPPRRRPSAKFDLDASYALLEVLGEGAYGTVYRARRRCDGKEVALKAMPREFTGRGDFEREVAALRLLGEGTDSNGNGDGRDEGDEAPREAGRDRIVKLYDLHRDDENYYLSMELVEGGELFDHLVAGGPFSEGRAATFLRQFAEGLSYAHNAGLVHADLKPENLLLSALEGDGGKGGARSRDDDQIPSLKLVDFGCARVHDASNRDLRLPAAEFARGCSFLHMAALGNQFEMERMLMERPGLANFRDYDFRTPLHLAASEGHVDICRFLVAKGARVNRTDRWGGSPLDDSHRHKHGDVVRYLREIGAKFGDSATAVSRFIEAASAGDVDEVRALLEYGTALDMNQGDYDGRTALHLATSEGRLKVVELLVDQDEADLNVEDRWGNRPLDDAKRAKRNSAEIVQLLKAHGATASGSFGANEGHVQVKKGGAGTSTGTLAYWPPEMFEEGATPTPPIDMWAAGVIMYIVLTGSHPFDKSGDKSTEEVQELIVKVGSSHEEDEEQNLMDELVFDERIEGLSDSCVELLRKLMHPDPKLRMTGEDFLRHPWIQGLTASWKKMDKTYEKHLQRLFKTKILKRFSGNDSGTDGRGEDEKVHIREIFNAIDIAGNGVLDANEIRIALRSAGEPEDLITNIVASLDLRSHGGKVKGVTFDEFQRIMNMSEE